MSKCFLTCSIFVVLLSHLSGFIYSMASGGSLASNEICCICKEPLVIQSALEGVNVDILIDLLNSTELSPDSKQGLIVTLFGLAKWRLALLCCGAKDNLICSQCALTVSSEEKGNCPLCRKYPLRVEATVNGKVFQHTFPFNLEFAVQLQLLIDFTNAFFSEDEVNRVSQALLKKYEDELPGFVDEILSEP